MSVQTRMHAAIHSQLREDATLNAALMGIFDAPPVRAARPYALVDEAVLVDWGAKALPGREGRFAVRLFDVGERPVRLRELAGAVEDSIAAMPQTLGGGWRIVSLHFLRSRITRDSEGWVATSEYRVRMLRTEL